MRKKEEKGPEGRGKRKGGGEDNDIGNLDSSISGVGAAYSLG